MTAMSSTDREIQREFSLRIAIDWPSVGKDMALLTAIAAFMAFTNPYRAANFDAFIWKFVYWMALILAGGLAGRAGYHLADIVQKPPHWALSIFSAAATASLAVTILIYVIAIIQYGWSAIPFWEFPQIYLFVMVISLNFSKISNI